MKVEKKNPPKLWVFLYFQADPLPSNFKATPKNVQPRLLTVISPLFCLSVLDLRETSGLLVRQRGAPRADDGIVRLVTNGRKKLQTVASIAALDRAPLLRRPGQQ